MPELKTITQIRDTRGAGQTARAAVRGLIRICATGFIGSLTLSLLLGFGMVIYFSLDPDVTVRINSDYVSMIWIIFFLLLAYASWVLGSKRKKIILYLRRFRQEAANEALSSAMYHSLRGVGRLVVLDDSKFVPVAIPFRERLIIIASALPSLAALLCALTLGASISGPVLLEGPNMSLSQTGFISISRGGNYTSDRTVYSGTPALLSFPGGLGIWLVLLASGSLTFRSLFSGWEARRRVSSEANIAALLKRVKFLGSKLASPKAIGSLATVVTVKDKYWQNVVAVLASRADAIILDISHPTDPIWWELLLCLEQHSHKLLLTMNAHDNFTLDSNGPSFAHYQELCDRVVELRHGVLFYDLSTSKARTYFYENLRNFVRLVD